MAEEEKKSEREDSVKLFVGQVPKHMNEAQLIELFQEFAIVDEVNVIKDEVSRASRGCCFVVCPSKEEADKAISACHNKLTLPGVSSPLQVKYANGELERLEHKLFVGMLPKNVSEEEVSALFSKYGAIKDMHILRGVQQTSKGCAFLKYERKEEALEAVNALNGIHKMKGSSLPLVVKWADTEKERQTRRLQKSMSKVVTMPNTNPQNPSLFGAAFPMGYVPPYNRYGYQGPPGTYGAMPYRMPPLQNHHQFHHMTTPSINQGNQISPEVSSRNYRMPPANYSSMNPGYHATQGIPYPMVYSLGMMPRRSFSSPATPTDGSSPSPSTSSPSSYGGQIEGPAGANLFIYHIPQEYGDQELANEFRPFGQVLSAKVFVDKATGYSKCFGFVSYDSPESAESAISKMHGHQIGNNKLKVQLKRENR